MAADFFRFCSFASFASWLRPKSRTENGQLFPRGALLRIRRMLECLGKKSMTTGWKMRSCSRHKLWEIGNHRPLLTSPRIFKPQVQATPILSYPFGNVPCHPTANHLEINIINITTDQHHLDILKDTESNYTALNCDFVIFMAMPAVILKHSKQVNSIFLAHGLLFFIVDHLLLLWDCCQPQIKSILTGVGVRIFPNSVITSVKKSEAHWKKTNHARNSSKHPMGNQHHPTSDGFPSNPTFTQIWAFVLMA